MQVMGGNVDFYFIPLAAAASALGSDKLVLLAVSSPDTRRAVAERAFRRRTRLSRRRLPFLERNIGAGENTA